MHTCVLEMKAGLLAMLPLPRNPVLREWYVVRVPSKQLTHVAQAFEQFLGARGQAEIESLIERRSHTRMRRLAA